MTCALCQKEADLCESHLIPSFVFKWLKDSSGTGYLRFSQNPNRRVQDGLKPELLCRNCDNVVLNEWETPFASKIFQPLHQNGTRRFEYGPWALKFSASVSWRCLGHLRAIGGLKHFNEAQLRLVNEALESWGAFILGKTAHPGNFEQHIVLLDRLADHTCENLPSNFNRYLLRGTEFDAVRTETSAFIYVKMCRVMLFGFVQEPHPNRWRGTKLRVRRGIVGETDIVLPGQLLGYFQKRAMKLAEMESRLSERQLDRILKDSEDKVVRVLASETFSASLHDYEMFGSPANKGPMDL